MKLNDIQQLALDLYNGEVIPSESYSNAREAEDRLRDMLNAKIAECKDFYDVKEKQYQIFRIVSQLVEIPVERLLRETFDPFADYQNVDYNELAEYEIDDDRLYDCSIVARDNNNLQRQRILGKKLRLDGFEIGLAVYDHFANFLAGKINFSKFIDKVERTIEERVTKEVGRTFTAAYGTAHTNLKVTGTVDESKLLELCEKVGKDSVIYGTRIALNKVPGLQAYDPDNKDKRDNGYVKLFNGHKCVVVENVYDETSDTWAFESKKLYIVPDGVKPIKIAMEGAPLVLEDTTGNKLDASISFQMKQRIQVGAIKTKKHGLYEISE